MISLRVSWELLLLLSLLLAAPVGLVGLMGTATLVLAALAGLAVLLPAVLVGLAVVLFAVLVGLDEAIELVVGGAGVGLRLRDAAALAVALSVDSESVILLGLAVVVGRATWQSSRYRETPWEASIGAPSRQELVAQTEMCEVRWRMRSVRQMQLSRYPVPWSCPQPNRHRTST